MRRPVKMDILIKEKLKKLELAYEKKFVNLPSSINNEKDLFYVTQILNGLSSIQILKDKYK